MTSMAYDETLAQRIRLLIKNGHGFSERKMFGGIAFLHAGRMCCGVLDSNLVARLSAEECTEALKRPQVRPMDFTGKPLKGFLYVGPTALRSETALRSWVDQCVTFVKTLPAKSAKKKSPRRKTAK